MILHHHLFIVLFLLAVVAVVVVVGQPPDPPSPDVYNFTQRFDHFSDNDTRKWTQKYLVYDKYYAGEGPIFFCPGGESEVEGGYNHNGLMFELGKKLGAFLLFPEHRFYGVSLPFGPVDSYRPENIVKLTIDQAMADYIEIIKYAKNYWKISDDTPLIAFGGSYPGDLTVYMRVAYPDVIDAGLASSAPLRYHVSQVPGGVFYQVVTSVFATHNSRCPDLVREAFSSIIEKSTSPEGRAEVTQKLRLCSPLEAGNAAIRLLALWIENAFASLGMEDYPYSLSNLPPFPLRASCDFMLASPDPITGLANTIGIFYNSSQNLKCYNISEEYYPCADITGCGGGVGDPDAMSWDYQSCTEIVSNVDTNNVTDMFPNAPYDIQALREYCLKQWNTIPDPTKIPQQYDYTKATRLILSNGILDPWFPGGVLPGTHCPKDSDITCLLIEEAAHHLDLRGSDPKNDPSAVVKAREEESSIITNWVVNVRKEKQLKKKSQ